MMELVTEVEETVEDGFSFDLYTFFAKDIGCKHIKCLSKLHI